MNFHACVVRFFFPGGQFYASRREQAFSGEYFNGREPGSKLGNVGSIPSSPARVLVSKPRSLRKTEKVHCFLPAQKGVV